LKKDFNLSEILIEGREELPKGFLGLQIQEGVVSVDRRSLSF